MRIAVLGWDHGVMDPDGPVLVSHARRRGHTAHLASLEDLELLPERGGGFRVLLGGTDARELDAVLVRAKLFGDEALDFRDRLERLTILDAVPGLAMFDTAKTWADTYSKVRTAQILAAAGLPATPLRSAVSHEQVRDAWEHWGGDIIVKPSYGLRGLDVERVRDPERDRDVLDGLFSRYTSLVCQPYYPTELGEYRITVAGERHPIDMLKLPAAGTWRCKTLEGASFERLDAPPDLVELSLAATREVGLTLSGLDVLRDGDRYVILEVNPVPGFLDIFGPEPHREVLDGVFDFVETHLEERRAESTQPARVGVPA